MNEKDAHFGMRVIYTGNNIELRGRTGKFIRTGSNPKVRFDTPWNGKKEWDTSYEKFSSCDGVRTITEILNS